MTILGQHYCNRGFKNTKKKWARDPFNSFLKDFSWAFPEQDFKLYKNVI